VRQPDITRAKQLLGWEPEVGLREGLVETVEHYTKVLASPAAR
jgi:nucleoside-diphosphate-sugar epimerase